MEEKLFDGDFFRSLKRISLWSENRLNGGRGGSRKSTAKGSSVEFSDFREYMPGDDIRRIDWNAYGRSEKLFIKLFMQEQEGMYTVVLDTIRSMKADMTEKYKLAARLAGMFGHLALQSQDRVRLVSIQDGMAQIEKSLTGMQSRNLFLDQVARQRFDGVTDLWQSVRHIPFPRKGTVILLSDFMDRDANGGHMETIHQTLRYLKFCKQDILILQILDKEERKPQLEGTVKLIDCETEQNLTVTMTSWLRKQYDNRLTAFQKGLESAAKKYQAHFMQVYTDTSLEKIIYDGMRAGVFEQV